MNHLDRARLDRGAQHLHSLGPRAVAHLLFEMADELDGHAVLDRLLTYSGSQSSEPGIAIIGGSCPRSLQRI